MQGGTVSDAWSGLFVTWGTNWCGEETIANSLPAPVSEMSVPASQPPLSDTGNGASDAVAYCSGVMCHDAVLTLRQGQRS